LPVTIATAVAERLFQNTPSY